jgi:colicin import membrane protein
METFADQARSLLLSVAAHVALILLVWFGVDWLLPRSDAQAAGEPVQASLRVSATELKRARAAMAKAEQVEEAAATKPQPVPEPKPQDSPTPPQPKPQEQLARPDTVEQEAISRTAIEPPPKPAPEEQEARHRQEQAELTEDIKRQQEAEHRQRLLAYQEATRKSEAAHRRTLMEEQRLQQLADLQSDPDPEPAPRAAPVREAAPAGNHGVDAGLLSAYKAAMLQTADQNWNHFKAPELTTCKVRFTQIPGGEVINVEFMRCPYDAEGREFVERALKKAPMPYSGFESVFMRQVELSFCYPREDCER